MWFPASLRERGIAVCAVLALGLTAPATGQAPPIDDARFAGIRRSLSSGDYVTAEAGAANLRLSLLQAPTTPVGDVLAATDLLVETLSRNGRGGEPSTLTMAREALRRREAHVGSNDPALAQSLRNLADTLVQAGQFASAVDPARRALALRERALGPDDPSLADDLDSLAVALMWAELWSEALTTADRALEIRVKTLGRDDVRLATSLEIQGQILQSMGLHGRARTAFEEAVRIREQSGISTPERAVSLSLLGEELWFAGDLVRAKQNCEQALMLAEGSLRAGHPQLALHLRRLALPVYDLGDALEARRLRERAVSIAQAAYGPDHPAVAIQLNDLANSLTHQAEYVGGRSLFERALKIYERLGLDSAGATAAAYNLAVVDARLGDYVAAERHYKQVIATWTRVRGAQSEYVAYGLFALADLREVQGLFAEARGLYEQALKIREVTVGDSSLYVARTLTSLARTLLASDDLSGAQERSTRAIRIWAQSGAQEDGYADALNVHASIQARSGDLVGAISSYREALTTLEKIHGPRHMYVSVGMTALAVSLASGGQFREAITNAFEAQEIAREHLRLTVRYLSEREALGYVARRQDALDVALSLLDQDQSSTARLFDLLVRSRSVTLDEMAARHATVGGDASTAGVTDLRLELTAARQRLANLVVRGGGSRPEQDPSAGRERHPRQRSARAPVGREERALQGRRKKQRRRSCRRHARACARDGTAVFLPIPAVRFF